MTLSFQGKITLHCCESWLPLSFLPLLVWD